ncbi:MAG: SMC-Scp complex subunit ScpB [Kiritimatiellae bacterium]|nr:SMC-Scp complex subunit ScpB [Kiritimatiellia bacterium]
MIHGQHMDKIEVMPELQQIIGALLFASKEPLMISQIRKALTGVAETGKEIEKQFGNATPKDIEKAIESLQKLLKENRCGFQIAEVAKEYRLENDTSCGPWLKELLNPTKPQRLSRPALETLAIIAYRQPCTRSEIEAVRGVAVDQMVRNLLDMQLIKIAGRSELPGRPWLFGTTQKFLEHFGLKNVDDLPGTAELKRLEEETLKSPSSQTEMDMGDEDDEEDNS